MDESQFIAIAIAAIAGTLGIIKFKLIEELVKKITSDDKNVRLYSIVVLSAIVVGIALLAPYVTSNVNDATQTIEVAQAEMPIEQTPAQKSDLEVKVDAVKDGVELTKDLVKSVKENKERKDSIFEASKSERWVFQINDWTDDDDRIVEIYKTVSMTSNVKLLKIKKQYLFIKDDHISRQQLDLSIDSLRETLPQLQLVPFDLNKVTTRKKDKLVERLETFGKRKNKVKIPCLVLD
jgi:hypothetical protein